jgi:hypothetical protein
MTTDRIKEIQETTLEEIAKKVYPDNIVQLSPTFFHNTADIRRHDFIQGYNLHKGELYSEEEVKELPTDKVDWNMLEETWFDWLYEELIENKQCKK